MHFEILDFTNSSSHVKKYVIKCIEQNLRYFADQINPTHSGLLEFKFINKNLHRQLGIHLNRNHGDPININVIGVNWGFMVSKICKKIKRKLDLTLKIPNKMVHNENELS